MTTAALARLLPLAPARLGLPARVSCALALAALVAACAPAPQESAYQLVRPAVAMPPYPQQPTYRTPDETDPVITAPTPAPGPVPPPDTKSAELQPQPAPAPAPVAPTPDPSNRSPTCGYWRFGCGILWQ